MVLFVIIFAVTGFMGFFYGGALLGENGGFIALGMAVPVSFVITLLARLVLSKFSSASGGALYGGRKPLWTVHEQFSAYISQAKHAIQNQNFDAAMAAVNKALKVDENWPEALFLKGKVMWEGFENLEGAKRYLKQVIQLTNQENAINIEALELFKQLQAIKAPRK